MDSDLVVEAGVSHVFVDLSTGVALAEDETLEMGVEGFLDDGVKRLVVGARRLRGRVVGGEDAGDFVGQDGEAVGGVFGVGFDAVEPPPDGVAAVKTGNEKTSRIANTLDLKLTVNCALHRANWVSIRVLDTQRSLECGTGLLDSAQSTKTTLLER